MERLVRAALAATLSILLVAGGSLAFTQTTAVDLATLQAAPWTLSELDGQTVAATAGITAAFAEDGSLTGSAGCNTFSGTYTLSGSSLTVGPLAATRKACEQAVMDDENLFLDLLQNATTWAIDGGSLTITAADGGTLVFGGDTAEPAPFTGTAWVLTSVSGQDVPAGVTATATFADDATVSGNAGCNDYDGPYTLGGDQAIKIGPLAATRKACEADVMDVENSFLNGLEAATGMEVVGDTLTLTAPDAGVTLVLTASGGTTPTPSEAPASPAPFTGTAWGLVDLDGTPIDPATGISVTFGDDGSISGFGGCNQLFGDYTADGGSLTVSGLAATRKFCGQDVMDLESEIITGLSDAESMAITGDTLTIATTDGTTLTFTAGAAAPVPTEVPPPTNAPEPTAAPTEAPASAVPSDSAVVGPTWLLSTLMSQPMPTGIVNVTITFNADGTITGNGGCTDFTGTYTLSGETISIAAITPAEGTCDASFEQIQQGLLQVLPFMDTASVVDGELHLDSSFGIQSVWTDTSAG
ncbi:MAG: META domain-containing protein [Chloroflexota bacterium]